MKDIKTIAGITFKVLIGVRLGKLGADIVSKVASKVTLSYLDKLKEKIELKLENNSEEPHMKIKK